MTAPAERCPVVFLMGPTASGKTGLAVELARRLPVDVISVDSALVYRGLDIGTAKPAPALRREIPHALVDIVEPEHAYSAGRFRVDALAEIEASTARGRVPLLVGGTMMYFQALAAGIGPMPPADAAVRADLARRARAQGGAVLHDELARVDPRAAARIHPNDPQRVQRALEVWHLTGRPISAWQTGGEPLDRPILRLAVAPHDRAVLHERIARRLDEMLAAGLVAEVEHLRRRPGLRPDLPAMRAVGYRQVWQYLDGAIDHAAMRDRALQATRQLAKRQLTWLRRERRVEWFDAVSVDAGEMAARIERFVTAEC